MTSTQILLLVAVAVFIVALGVRIAPLGDADDVTPELRPRSRGERRLWRRVARLPRPAQRRLLAFLSHELDDDDSLPEA